MEQKPYFEQVDIQNTKKLREMLTALPPFCVTFFRGIEQTTSSRTRIAYAYDLKVFFEFLLKENPALKGKEMRDITLSDLDMVKAFDLEEYMEYLKYYSSDENTEHINKERGITRKLSSLKTFYNYFYKKELLKNNPAALISLPKLHSKDIIRLDIDEVASLLDNVENGEGLTERQKAFHEKTKIRDVAILTLLLGTGIRVSECVGLDLNDVDFKNDGIRIHRKGGKEVVVYFGEEVRDALLDYLEERKRIIPVSGHEQAFFLSLQSRRISVKSVENLVKKYAKLVTPLKKITPHKLRSTYGTNLYRETGDIYLVADVLGHSDVNTTRKHYAALEDERRRSARNAVRLREKP
ncbi:tyrosine-type recombinase/integrase [Fusibacillus kribbianus]|uniref:Tyrosine-type recombinase/integrase n=1 Tax=Fusibacillus kribbianus TaxID=3044208 RepID=A0AAP4EYQ0_9FIRM|nr:tyrosine-type recombinase/integrase [Ruminococcus sp. YH-rum2234]MDI9243222.1 tyrosine-type recombinase/integrase [Ruminococcus sp. YH-rum2234]